MTAASRKSNRPTLADLGTMPVSELAAFPSAVLYDLQSELDEAKETLRKRQVAFFSALEVRYAAEANQKLKASGKTSGVVHIVDEAHDVQFEAKTKDEWNQASLVTLWDEITRSGEDPRIYMRRELSVQRTVLKSWPEEFQKPFLAALTAKSQKPTYRITPVKGSGK